MLLLEIPFIMVGFVCIISRSGAESVVESLGIGIDEVSSVLKEYESKCSYPTLSEDLEDSVSRLENIIEDKGKTMVNIEMAVQNVTNQTQHLLENYFQVFPTPPPEPCAHPFERAAGSCFWAHKNPTLSFDDARTYCQQEGGDLATPEDMGAVISYLSSKLGTGWLTVWIGGKYFRQWIWVTSKEPMNLDSEYILPYNQYRANGACGALHGRKGYRIMELDCDESHWYLCEKKV